MKNLNEFQLNQLGTLLFGYLTNYRMVPALYLLARERQPADKHTSEWQRRMEKVLNGLKEDLSRRAGTINSSSSCLSNEDILELVYEHRNLIRYTFHDMLYYYEYIKGGAEDEASEMNRMRYYLPAMAEIVNSPFIEWRHGTFDTGVEHPTVLDVGSGNFPFLKLFRRDNTGNVWYAGIDIRGANLKLKPPDKVFVNQYVMGIEKFLGSKQTYIQNKRKDIDTAFFGNSLHCLQHPVHVLKKVAKLPKVSKIMVVEFALESALNFMFDFHMYLHAGTGACATPIPLEGWKCEGSRPTTQHVMHTYTKR